MWLLYLELVKLTKIVYGERFRINEDLVIKEL